MKVNRHITIELDILDKLSNISNFSGLIEQLLTDYISNNKPNNEKIKQKRADLKELKAKIASIKLEMKQISHISSIESQLKSKISDKEDLISLTKEAHLWYYGKNHDKLREQMLNSDYKSIVDFYKEVKK